MHLIQCTAPSPCAGRAAARQAPRSLRPTFRVQSAQKQSAPLGEPLNARLLSAGVPAHLVGAPLARSTALYRASLDL